MSDGPLLAELLKVAISVIIVYAVGYRLGLSHGRRVPPGRDTPNE